jgi:uncharacterized protein (DUF1330 family)
MKGKKREILKWLALAVLLIGSAGAFIGYRMWTKPHRSVEDAVSLTVTAEQVVADYESDEQKANAKYLDKVMLIKGNVEEITKNQQGEAIIVLKATDMGTVRCSMEKEPASPPQPGTAVSIKGICTGYLSDAIMVRCLLADK